MDFLLRYDRIGKVYRIKRAAIYALWLLLLLIWIIPPVPDFDKMLVVALEDISRVFLEVNPTLESVKETMGGEEPLVKTASRGFDEHGPVEYERIYIFRRNDKQKTQLSYFFWRGELDGITGFATQYRRRGVPYALIRENCLNAVRDRFGTIFNNISRYERADKYLFRIFGNDASWHVVTINFEDNRVSGRRVWPWGKLSVFIAPREKVILYLSYGREWQEGRRGQ